MRDTGFGSLARDDVHLRRVARKRPCGRTRTRLAGQRLSRRLRARRRKHQPDFSGSSCSALSGAPFGLSQLVSPVASLCQNVLPVPNDSHARQPCSHARRQAGFANLSPGGLRSQRVHRALTAFLSMLMRARRFWRSDVMHGTISGSRFGSRANASMRKATCKVSETNRCDGWQRR